MGRGEGGIPEPKVEGADREEGYSLSRHCIVYRGGELGDSLTLEALQPR